MLIMNHKDLENFDSVRDFAMSLINELSVAKMVSKNNADLPDIRHLTHTLDGLIELEHQADFVDTIYNDDDVDPDDESAPFNVDGMFQRWFTDRADALEAAIEHHDDLHELYDETSFDIDTAHSSFNYKGDFVDLDLRFRIQLNQSFVAELPGRVFKNAPIEEILHRIHILHMNDCYQPNWKTVYQIDPRQLDKHVIPDYDAFMRKKRR